MSNPSYTNSKLGRRAGRERQEKQEDILEKTT